MTDLGENLGPEIAAACQAGATQASQLLSRAFDAQLQLEVREPAALAKPELEQELAGPGLVLLFGLGAQAAVLAIPESTGLLPESHRRADVTTTERWTALARELAKVLLPATLTVKDCLAAAVADLPAALERGIGTGSAERVPLVLAGGEEPSPQLSLIWPMRDPGAVFDLVAPPVSQKKVAPRVTETADRLHLLPPYSRSLLKIKVPVAVTLAAKKQPVGEITEIVPGSILQFNKSCDETLELEVGTQRIALGECVKVGDKFGLRITSLTLPDERFQSIGTRESSGR